MSAATLDVDVIANKNALVKLNYRLDSLSITCMVFSMSHSTCALAGSLALLRSLVRLCFTPNINRDKLIIFDSIIS